MGSPSMFASVTRFMVRHGKTIFTMKSAILFLAVAFVAPTYALTNVTNFYNWTEEQVETSFSFAEFADDKLWYEVKLWSQEQDPNSLDNMIFVVNKTSDSEAAVALVGTRMSDPSAKCVHLSGSGRMNFSLPNPAEQAKMVFYISPRFDTTKFNILSINKTSDAVIIISIQCVTVAANGTCSKGLKVNVLSSNRVVSASTNERINSIITRLKLTPTANDFYTTKQDKDCPTTRPAGGANHVRLGLLTLLVGLVIATVLI